REAAPVDVLPWLYVVCRNQALNLIRDERAHDQLDENYDGVPQPPEIAMRHEELAGLVAQIKDLPRNQREALVQREMEGRSHDRIGASLGVSATSARGLIFRARTTLRSAAGVVITLSLLRALLKAEPARATGIAAAGSGGAAGLAGGSATVLAVKGAAVLAGVATLVAGSGLVFNQGRDLVASEAVAAGASGQGHNTSLPLHDLAATEASMHRNNKPGGRDDGPKRPGSRKPGAPGSPDGDDATASEAPASEPTDEPRVKEVDDDAAEDWDNDEADADVEAGDDGGASDADGDEAEIEIDEDIDPEHLDSQSSPDDQED
ncbi:MAG: sigma-70 family RNA polymerase sigma factor, partial [Solirubrobacterales bacterium]